MLNNGLDREPITKATRAVIFALLLGLTSAIAAAQSGFVSFTGRIVDEQGRSVQGVGVGLANEAREAKYEVKTNADGRFEFVGLPPGDYTVDALGMGFQPIKDVVTIKGQNLSRDYSMKLGTLQETIVLRFDPSDAIKQPVHDSPSVGNTVVVTKKECVVSAGGGRIVPPKKIRDAKPYYPSALRGAWTEGVVQMEARIGLDGYVADVRIVGDAQPDLAQSAVAAVREWRFTETLLNCTPVEVMMMVTVNFNRQR